MCFSFVSNGLSYEKVSIRWKGVPACIALNALTSKKKDMMYLYFDRSCLCANNMYIAANFHICNLMTGLKKDLSLCTENEESVIRTFGRAIPVINFSHRIKHFEKDNIVFSRQIFEYLIFIIVQH